MFPAVSIETAAPLAAPLAVADAAQATEPDCEYLTRKKLSLEAPERTVVSKVILEKNPPVAYISPALTAIGFPQLYIAFPTLPVPTPLSAQIQLCAKATQGRKTMNMNTSDFFIDVFYVLQI